MSKILSDGELEDAEYWMGVAVAASLDSPCKRDKRGVAIVHSKRGLIGIGFNSPPKGFICEPKFCEPTCKDYAIHAEMNAIINVFQSGESRYLNGAIMYHARTTGGKLVDSRKPRCYSCSKHLEGFGIKGFVLKHKEGYTLYDIKEFNKISLENFFNISK